MTTYRSLPVEVEAVQFKNLNFEELREFTGRRLVDGDHSIDLVHPLGTYLPKHEFPGYVAELWVEANKAWLPLEDGEWVIKDAIGFYPCKNEIFIRKYALVEDAGILDGDWEKIPVLNEMASDARMLGRVRMALMMSRPQSEVDVICDRLVHILAHYRVGQEEGMAQNLDLAISELTEATANRVMAELGMNPAEIEVITRGLMDAGFRIREYDDEETMEKTQRGIMKGLVDVGLETDQEIVTAVINAIQNEGILLRERIVKI
jgi:hypothetical protein